ncbi:ABC transporter [Aureibacillus halotolerans]|uniref:ABC-2 type transport system permease protein n=1 Tax=Aureibacillus halotolerans TaxID=1508390 RepID=A0A4R6U7Z8_9BACI|nr:ABC transporter [Aureibacillus halotolerans]TDQ40889.1 ABC-2 type transport system permease protein [Aureibacillus halotolerans]
MGSLLLLTFKRMLRDYIGVSLLVVLPIGLISLIGLVAGYMAIPEGIPVMDWLSISFVLSFQLFGGAYTMSYLKEDMFSPRRWRIMSLPLRIDLYSFIIVTASTCYSMVQGLSIVLFTHLVYGVHWGNILWLLVVLFLISLLSQIVCLICLLTVKSFKLAERLSEVYGIGSMVFAGLIFGLPNNGFFTFMNTYGNPVSVARHAILEMLDGVASQAALFAVLLLAASLLLFPVTAWLGKRRLA